MYADAVTTVSPTYAREILTPSTAGARRQPARTRGDLVGILNGVDYDDWDPRHDRYLPRTSIRTGSRSRPS
jgi:starch synthase